MEKFNMNAETVLDALDYMHNRYNQLKKLGYLMTDMTAHEWGVDCIFFKDNQEYQSIYIIVPFRNKGLYPSLVKKTILTSKQCEIEDYLTSKNIDFVSIDLDDNI